MIVNRASFLAASDPGFFSSSKWGRPPMRLYRNLPCTLFCTSRGGGTSTILIYTTQENTIRPSLSTYLVYSRVTYYHSLPRPIFCGHSIPRGPSARCLHTLTSPYLKYVRTNQIDKIFPKPILKTVTHGRNTYVALVAPNQLHTFPSCLRVGAHSLGLRMLEKVVVNFVIPSY